MNSTLWILVANQTIARIYRHAGEGRPPVLELAIEHPAGRARTHQLISDRPGRAFGAISPIRHALGPANDAHENEADAFARVVAERLKEERRRERYAGLALVCEPKFLGRLRASLDRETAKTVIAARAAGLTALSERELGRALQGLIEPAHAVRLG